MTVQQMMMLPKGTKIRILSSDATLKTGAVYTIGNVAPSADYFRPGCCWLFVNETEQHHLFAGDKNSPIGYKFELANQKKKKKDFIVKNPINKPREIT